MNYGSNQRRLGDYDAVLFDFGNTLADEFYFGHRPDYFPDFPDVIKRELYDTYYADPSGENTLNLWMDGKISKVEVAQILANKSCISADLIVQAMADSCRKIKIFHKAMRVAESVGKATKTAIVTINADVFSEFIVPSYGLEKTFHGIFNSCKYRTRSKLELCRYALKELGDLHIANSILIDNTAQNCQDFAAAGGNAYVFTTEDEFISQFS